MRFDQLALLFALVIAAYVVVLIALQLPRLGRRLGRGPDGSEMTTWAGGGAPVDHIDTGRGARGAVLLRSTTMLPAALYQRMTRVVGFMFIGAAMAVVVLTGSPDQTAIIVLLAFGLILIELFQDVLPQSALGRWRLPLEAVLALAFLTVLLLMTGGQSSPFFFGYVLLVGAAALSTSSVAAALLAVITSVAYIVAVLLAVNSAPLSSADLGLVAFNLVALALVTYVGSVIGREQRRAREEALRLSRFDSMTGLHSRDYFMSELEQEILRASRTGRPFAVAMLDLDGLKAANDRFGHDWGDNLLRAVADVLRGDIRVTDVAARYGGDEFVLMLPETDLAGAILVAEKVRVDISRVALPHNGAVVRTSASIGIVTFADDGRTSAELMRRADLAMYEAKRRGRDQIVRFARGEAQEPGAAPSIISQPPAASTGPPTGGRSIQRYPVTPAGAAVGPGSARQAEGGARDSLVGGRDGRGPAQEQPDIAASERDTTPAIPEADEQKVAAGVSSADAPASDIPPASPGPAPWELP